MVFVVYVLEKFGICIFLPIKVLNYEVLVVQVNCSEEFLR